MRLLLDTHVAVWWVSGNDLLSQRGRDLVDDQANSLAVSVASIWEAAIKNRLNRVNAIGISAEMMAATIAESGAQLIDVGVRHVVRLEQLPLLHGDPFDRLIVATSIADTYRLVTHDRTLAAYGDHVLLV